MAECIHCHAVRFQYEPPTFCCGNGSIKMANPEVPAQLYELFVSHSEEAKEFQRNIRACNSIFVFTSFGVTLDKQLASSRKGVYTFKAQGVQREVKCFVFCREYYCYKIQVRRGKKSILLLCGLLLQQFVVDMYIKLEITRLEYFLFDQSNFRREILQGIVDSIMAGEYRGDKVGQRETNLKGYHENGKDSNRRSRSTNQGGEVPCKIVILIRALEEDY
ncbi:uncharacterized protein [Nicotiana tomentosiformis]|uniref:uncharacterized protein n=1 Tax=Nicotiana tomentosiformis TaxID=4098 RepID=UPI00388C9A8D